MKIIQSYFSFLIFKYTLYIKNHLIYKDTFILKKSFSNIVIKNYKFYNNYYYINKIKFLQY